MIAFLYLALLATLVPFGLHRLTLLWRRWRTPPVPLARRAADPGPGGGASSGAGAPFVTVQLPIYNEANVVERLIDAACSIEHPRDRFEVQVLDDSEDRTPQLAAEAVERWTRRGVCVRHVRRGTREGFKAGALAHGVDRARGEFLLVLDADFVPPPDLVARLLPSFEDPEVGAVQAAWAHLNAGESWLTRAQALFLDAHFAIEHEARHRAGLFFNFNGSAGMWRRACLEDAGGWQSDTLTEDVDLSYRAQLAGWRLVYRDDVRVPAELPESLRAVELQQERWAQGGVETARKLLGEVWSARIGRDRKVEATAHLLGHFVHPLTLMLGLALGLFGLLAPGHAGIPAWVHVAALGLATLPFTLFYGAAARLRGSTLSSIPARVFEALLLGLGLGVPLAGAVFRGAIGTRRPFLRTPKSGERRVPYTAALNRPAAWLRAALGGLLLVASLRLLLGDAPGALPFTALFAVGYLMATREALRPEPA